MSDPDEIGRQVAKNLSGAIARALESEEYESARSSSSESAQDETIQPTESSAAAPSPRSKFLQTTLEALAARRQIQPTSPLAAGTEGSRPNMADAAAVAAAAAAKRANDAAAEADAERGTDRQRGVKLRCGRVPRVVADQHAGEKEQALIGERPITSSGAARGWGLAYRPKPTWRAAAHPERPGA